MGSAKTWSDQELSQRESRKAIVLPAIKDGLYHTMSPPPSEPQFSWDFPDLTILHWLGLCLAESNRKPYYNGLNK